MEGTTLAIVNMILGYCLFRILEYVIKDNWKKIKKSLRFMKGSGKK